MRSAPKHTRWMAFVLLDLQTPALNLSQSAATGLHIVEAIARRVYSICRKAIENLQSTLTSKCRGIFESQSHWSNLRALAISKIVASFINVRPALARLEKDKESCIRSYEFPWSNEPVPAWIIWLCWLRNVLFILAILLWIIAALMN
jgi:hypothetical protein